MLGSVCDEWTTGACANGPRVDARFETVLLKAVCGAAATYVNGVISALEYGLEAVKVEDHDTRASRLRVWGLSRRLTTSWDTLL